MDKFSVFFILAVIFGVTDGSPKIERDDGVRQKRNVFETMQSAALIGASEVASKFQEGVGFKDNSDREINFFGAKIGGGNNFKTGFGHAVEDESMERRRRDLTSLEGEEVIFKDDDGDEIIIEENEGHHKRPRMQQQQNGRRHLEEEEEIVIVDEDGDEIIIIEEEGEHRAHMRKPHFQRQEEEIIIVDEDNEQFRRRPNGRRQSFEHRDEEEVIIVEDRKRRSADDSADYSTDISDMFGSSHERLKRSALRSYSMAKKLSSESSSEEKFETTTPEIETSSPLVMHRKKRAAKPCFGAKRTQPAGGDYDDAEEFQQLKKSKKRNRGKRQAPNPLESVSGPNSFSNGGSDIPMDQQDERFQQFMEQMMVSVRKVATIAKKVQEAFQQPPVAPMT